MWNFAAMQAAANTLRALATHAQLHTAPSGAFYTDNASAAARQPVTWTAPANDGDFDIAALLVFTGGAADGPVYSVTFWNDLTAGVCYGEFPIGVGDPAFSPSGEYTLSSISHDGNAVDG